MKGNKRDSRKEERGPRGWEGVAKKNEKKVKLIVHPILTVFLYIIFFQKGASHITMESFILLLKPDDVTATTHPRYDVFCGSSRDWPPRRASSRSPYRDWCSLWWKMSQRCRQC